MPETLGDDNPDALPSPLRASCVWWTLRAVLRLLLTIMLGYRARGVKRVAAQGGGLVLINHQSNFDPMLVGLPLARPISYMARDSLFPLPVIGWILKRTYVVPISREAAGSESIRELIRRIEHGFLVGVFPEGTRTHDGRMGEFKPGFLAVARRARMPLYPVGIAGAYKAWPRRWKLPRPGRVRLVFGEPIPADEVERLCGRGRQRELLDVVRVRVDECRREAEDWLGHRG